MSDTTIHDTPDLSAALARVDPWRGDRGAFAAMLPSVLATHRDQYVAVHNGQVVASGAALVDVALEAYRRVGYVPVYVDLVTDLPPEPARITSPRLQENWPPFRSVRRLRGPFAEAPISWEEDAAT